MSEIFQSHLYQMLSKEAPERGNSIKSLICHRTDLGRITSDWNPTDLDVIWMEQGGRGGLGGGGGRGRVYPESCRRRRSLFRRRRRFVQEEEDIQNRTHNKGESIWKLRRRSWEPCLGLPLLYTLPQTHGSHSGLNRLCRNCSLCLHSSCALNTRSSSTATMRFACQDTSSMRMFMRACMRARRVCAGKCVCAVREHVHVRLLSGQTSHTASRWREALTRS